MTFASEDTGSVDTSLTMHASRCHRRTDACECLEGKLQESVLGSDANESACVRSADACGF